MSTTHTIEYETEVDALASADEFVIHDASAVAAKKCEASKVRAFVGSGAVDATAATLAVTQATHGGQTISMNRAAGITATLPAATGTGAVFRFVVTTTVTSNSNIIQVANATDEFVGIVYQVDADTGDALVAYPALDADGFDTITMDGSTTGGIQGDIYTIIDIATGKFQLIGHQTGTGTVATPLSAAVA